eukprot:TRINITY_DN2498_c1_g1_i1.p1 TRINITY_DN2498_c1_g1~~TRINITY_DN2498_c1_g1_i1.p1  ORF type:complete len:279 (-),score=88.10 TRINITY_DN2498_c1_g1_i1:346-1182(-)
MMLMMLGDSPPQQREGSPVILPPPLSPENIIEDDTAAMLAEDADKPRKEDMTLEQIENEFESVKTQFFTKKLDLLDKQLEEVKAGTHPILVAQHTELDDMLQERVWAAEQWKQYQLDNLCAACEHEKSVADQECKLEKAATRERMLNKLGEKRRKILDSRSQMTLSAIARPMRKRQAPLQATTTSVTVSASRRKFNPPHISHALKESEIMEDLSAIRRALQTCSVNNGNGNTINSTGGSNVASTPLPKCSTLRAFSFPKRKDRAKALTTTAWAKDGAP